MTLQKDADEGALRHAVAGTQSRAAKALPTCFLRSSGRPAPPQAGAGCAGIARSGCLAAAASSPALVLPEAPPVAHPLLLPIRLTVGSFPLFSFLLKGRFGA